MQNICSMVMVNSSMHTGFFCLTDLRYNKESKYIAVLYFFIVVISIFSNKVHLHV